MRRGTVRESSGNGTVCAILERILLPLSSTLGLKMN